MWIRRDKIKEDEGKDKEWFKGEGSGREIIEFFGGSCHLSTIPLKNFYLFKIAESVINFCLKNFSN